jgi:N-acetylneuraminic acid mutarotase
MHRSTTYAAFTAALLVLAACGDENLPSEPQTSGPETGSPTAPRTGLAEVSNSWTRKASLPTARSGLVAATVNGRIYAIGGKMADQTPLATVEAFAPDATIYQWYPRKSMPAPRAYPSGAAVINGKIYVPGGFNAQGEATKSLYVYNVAANTWSTKAQMPTPNGAGASAAIDGKLYVLVGPRPGDPPKSKLYRYDPTTDDWTGRPSPGVILQGAVVAAIGGKLYAAGGVGASDTPLATLYVYNPANDSWTTKAGMITGRKWAMGQVVNGKLILTGGIAANGATKKTEVYDPAANQWNGRADLSGPRWMGAASAADGLLFVLGGQMPNSMAVSNNEAFTP